MRCSVSRTYVGFADTGPEGPAGSQGSAPKLGLEACYIEKFEGAARAGFINQCGCPTLGEVGLYNFFIFTKKLNTAKKLVGNK